MSVCPGFGGQKFQPHALEKIRKLRAILDDQKPTAQVAVDGGVSKETIGELYNAGANFFVAGSAVFKADDIGQAIVELREACQ